jgi:iron complex transport system ATP-binding protein
VPASSMVDTTSTPAVELSGVELAVGGTPILRGIDWTVGADERWVIVGPNGSGKTSLLRIAALLQAPSHGSVTVLGARYGKADVREVRQGIGFASAAVLGELRPGLTAHDAVVTGLHAARETWWHTYRAAERQRADDLLAFVGCAAHRAQEIGSLSEGERKRVLVARMLMAEPSLLLLDEPCAGLDLGGREALVAVVAELTATHEGAVVMVTHHFEEMPPGFTHALLLRDGRAVGSGPIDVVLTSAAVSDCFGLPVVVEASDGRWSARVASRPQ